MEIHSQDVGGATRRAVFTPDWAGFGGTHGGLVAAHMQQAAADVCGATPRSVTVHLLDPVPPGTFDIRVHTLRGGRSAASSATIDGLATALIRQTHGPDSPPAVWPHHAPPPTNRPDPDSLDRFTPPEDIVHFGRHLDIRPLSGALPLTSGTEPSYEAWVRLAPEAADIGHLDENATRLILIDAMPPGLFALWDRPAPVPTLELSVHLAPCRPDGPWYLIRHRTVWASEDLCVDETALHTRDGHLAAQGRQLRRLIRT
ncbi:acyl-CoA thioesterase II [Nocardiopsis sp. FIRDI 009]|uniref:acyl-CoA thioesterase n=1 Tax=Nocardiopsis sp. FIRDI 009 TaxID=714197 RepID=UPI000E22EBF8|nr:thioesterase family protein [Nocardiopsis sp. FIRDI 009]